MTYKAFCKARLNKPITFVGYNLTLRKQGDLFYVEIDGDNGEGFPLTERADDAIETAKGIIAQTHNGLIK